MDDGDRRHPGDVTLGSTLDVRQLFEAHGDFVWRVLARAGVRDADLKDALQEVFIIVSQKLDTLEEGTKPTTWLHGIAVRVAANHRRKVARKREDLTAESDETAPSSGRGDPEENVARAEARAMLAEMLDELPPEQRIVFEMFELEEMACPKIAEALGIPLGTTYTRLRAARAALTAQAAEMTA
ncbi:MAG: sigma-70 family RNA polymerase sigma factor [Deltaproteobacteria bacterium]|nr:sigma-70 family RNA polymerase sigma factor [Deltaproteobacteria bacterium]